MPDISKLDPTLQSLLRLASKGRLTEEVVVDGQRFTMTTLVEAESNWRDAHTDGSSGVSLLSSRKAPTLAIAIRAINGVPIENLFEKEWLALPESVRELAEDEPFGKQVWFAGSLLELMRLEFDPSFIRDMYAGFEKLEMKAQLGAERTEDLMSSDPPQGSSATPAPSSSDSKPGLPADSEDSFGSVIATKR